jgi:hypothetical protein
MEIPDKIMGTGDNKMEVSLACGKQIGLKRHDASRMAIQNLFRR